MPAPTFNVGDLVKLKGIPSNPMIVVAVTGTKIDLFYHSTVDGCRFLTLDAAYIEKVV